MSDFKGLDGLRLDAIIRMLLYRQFINRRLGHWPAWASCRVQRRFV